MSKYFKTIYTVTVLSEGSSLGNADLSVIDQEITDGSCVGMCEEAEIEELSADEMRLALKEVGSDESFFPCLSEEDEDESEVPTALDKGPGDEAEDPESDPEADPDEDLKWDPDTDDGELFEDDADGDEEITED